MIIAQIQKKTGDLESGTALWGLWMHLTDGERVLDVDEIVWDAVAALGSFCAVLD
jgi:hypothetical protein